jgi:hypothetical protein
VKLAYKGEPQDFDIVVGCNVHTIRYKDNSSTYEAGLTPTVYGRRMSDGKGLVIRPPDACLGQTTANGRVPTDLMPLVLVYDDADKLGFGIAYASDEAYVSPLSALTFSGATVEKATRSDFDAFREKGAPNLVSRASYFSNQPREYLTKLGLEPVWPPLGRDCFAYVRFHIPESAKGAVRKFWPPDKPNYWTVPTYEGLRAARSGIGDVDDVQRDTGGPFISQGQFGAFEWIDDRGIMRVKGGGNVDPGTNPPIAPSFYPARSEISADNWPAPPDEARWVVAGKQKIVTDQIDFKGGASRGFAYCYTSNPPIHDRSIIDGIPERVAQVDGSQIIGATRYWGDPAVITGFFFERDEFYFSLREFNIESTRGDV